MQLENESDVRRAEIEFAWAQKDAENYGHALMNAAQYIRVASEAEIEQDKAENMMLMAQAEAAFYRERCAMLEVENDKLRYKIQQLEQDLIIDSWDW